MSDTIETVTEYTHSISNRYSAHLKCDGERLWYRDREDYFDVDVVRALMEVAQNGIDKSVDVGSKTIEMNDSRIGGGEHSSYSVRFCFDSGSRRTDADEVLDLIDHAQQRS